MCTSGRCLERAARLIPRVLQQLQDARQNGHQVTSYRSASTSTLTSLLHVPQTLLQCGLVGLPIHVARRYTYITEQDALRVMHRMRAAEHRMLQEEADNLPISDFVGVPRSPTYRRNQIRGIRLDINALSKHVGWRFLPKQLSDSELDELLQEARKNHERGDCCFTPTSVCVHTYDYEVGPGLARESGEWTAEELAKYAAHDALFRASCDGVRYRDDKEHLLRLHGRLLGQDVARVSNWPTLGGSLRYSRRLLGSRAHGLRSSIATRSFSSKPTRAQLEARFQELEELDRRGEEEEPPFVKTILVNCGPSDPSGEWTELELATFDSLDALVAAEVADYYGYANKVVWPRHATANAFSLPRISPQLLQRLIRLPAHISRRFSSSSAFTRAEHDARLELEWRRMSEEPDEDTRCTPIETWTVRVCPEEWTAKEIAEYWEIDAMVKADQAENPVTIVEEVQVIKTGPLKSSRTWVNVGGMPFARSTHSLLQLPGHHTHVTRRHYSKKHLSDAELAVLVEKARQLTKDPRTIVSVVEVPCTPPPGGYSAKTLATFDALDAMIAANPPRYPASAPPPPRYRRKVTWADFYASRVKVRHRYRRGWN